MSGHEKSMPRKSKHGTDVARWGDHREMKEDRKKGRNKFKQKWKKEMKQETNMAKQQMQNWVGKNCKFALADRADKIATLIVNKITEASKEVTGEQFIDIVVATLSKIAAVPVPPAMLENIKKILRTKIEGKEKYSGPQMQALMKEILLGTPEEPGIVRQFGYDINSPVILNAIQQVINEMHERKGPSDRPKGDYDQRRRQEQQEAEGFIEKGPPKIHFTKSPPKR